MIEFLLNDILRFHEQLNAAKGIRDLGLIESAINNPFQTFDGKFLYPTIFDKATQIFFGLAKNHGFIDGNKRVAVHALNTFMRANGLILNVPDDELFQSTMKVAKSEWLADKFKEWLLKQSVTQIIINGTITIKL